MLSITVAVAYGTVLESRFNADMARLMIYQAPWFQCLLLLLWANIFCATLSRLPFKTHHIGFIITHIGLLTLLIGAFVTNIWGIDGQLQVAEKSKNNEVSLPELVLELINRNTNAITTFPIERRLHDATQEDFKNINESLAGRLAVMSYLPFAKSEHVFEASAGETMAAREVGVSFRLKSAFFDVTEWLHSGEDSERQLGPAHLSLIVHQGADSAETTRAVAQKSAPPAQAVPRGGTHRPSCGSGKQEKIIKEAFSPQLSATRKGPVEAGPLLLAVTGVFEQALVGPKGKIQEGGQKNGNPALELSVVHQNEKLREVIYAKYPSFTLHEDGLFGYALRYLNSSAPSAPTPVTSKKMPNDSVHAKLHQGGASTSGGNVIQFHVYEGTPDKVLLKLLKGGAEVLTRWMKRGDSVETPWMGIQISLNELVFNGAQSQKVSPAALVQRTDMPPSALSLKPQSENDAKPFWLLENAAQDVRLAGTPYQIYFGRKTMRLPFEVYLEKFTKVDYPGTQTPLSFESLVKVNGEPPRRIVMNEPLTLAGFTLYQASYVAKPGETPISIFSVNWDPGRWIKYMGSLILVFGIITFTLTHSRMNRKKRGT